MGLRKNVCYRRIKRPYTRISHRVQRKSFITGVPGPKIHHFEGGRKGGEYDTMVRLLAVEKGTVRHNALEAMRITANRHLQKVGVTNFFFQIPSYPYHVLRENPMATGAGADRFSEGMRRAFGKPVGRATRVFVDKPLMNVKTYKKFTNEVKDALKRARQKISMPCRVEITEIPQTA